MSSRGASFVELPSLSLPAHSGWRISPKFPRGSPRTLPVGFSVAFWALRSRTSPMPGALTPDKNHLRSCFGNSISRPRSPGEESPAGFLPPAVPGGRGDLIPTHGNELMGSLLRLWDPRLPGTRLGNEGFSPKNSIKPNQTIPVNLRSHRRKLGAGGGGGKVSQDVEKTLRKIPRKPRENPFSVK